MTTVAVRTLALVGVAVIIIGLAVSSVWDAPDINPSTSWRSYASAWVGVILLVFVIAIALRAAESARCGSLDDAPFLAIGGVITILAALFLFGGAIAALGGLALVLGGVAGILGRAPSPGANRPE